MDWLRIVLVFIAYCQLDVSITSPQQASEMGQKPGDKPYKDDDPPSLKRKQSYRALFSILSLYHLYWYGSE